MQKHSLMIGGSQFELKKSITQIAVRARTGADDELENEIQSLSQRHPILRRGNLGAYQIVEINADEETVNRERGVLKHASSVQDEIAVYHTSNDKVPFVPEGTIYIEFTDGTSTEEKQKIIDKYALQLVESERDGALTVRPTVTNEDAVEVSARMQTEAAISFAEPDLATKGSLKSLDLTSDPLLEHQWHLRNVGQHRGESTGYTKGADARVIEAWKILGNRGNPNVILGVIDDGFDLMHPDLENKSKAPWDFTRHSDDVSPMPNIRDQRFGDWHGTACAGVATARAGSGQVVGAAPEAQLIPVRWGPSLEPRGVAKWFDHMTDNGAWLLSCSWGAHAAVFPLHIRIVRAIERCARDGREGKGMVVLFAAGNSRRDINNPPHSFDGFAVHPDVIAVAASTSRDERSNYSNYGAEVSICAPSSGKGGWGITTADVQGTYTDANGIRRPMGYSIGDYTHGFGGTSSACPLAAGVAALVLGAHPDLTAAEVRKILESTARKIGDLSTYDAEGHSPYHGYGCVNAADAVKLALKLRAEAANAAETV